MQSPLSPRDAVKHFRLAPGLRIELVACEPQIESPVAMAFDAEGKLWVVEMRDYPNGPGRGQKPEGRIRILEDRDGDGVFETSSVFSDGLLFANGLLPWRDGVLVTAAPAIFHLARSPDGQAPKRTVLFEGFAAQNPQLRVSHPNLGIDNWIYVANGLRGGMVKDARNPAAKPINLSGMDFRFDLIHRRHEAISGLGQYGNTFDDWGRRFVCDNRHHLRHVVVEDRYLKRNPYLAVDGVVEDISELKDGPLGSGGKIYPISSNWTTSSLHEGRFTAACGVFIHRDDLLPPEYHASAFTCDPTGNLVHREILQPHGATFRSRPDRKGIEFLASDDDWFRPVFLTSGPDGALYVVDMYRAVIEHPEFMPPELQKRPDLTLGKDKGRIWRIVPEGSQTKRPVQHWSKASSEKLATLLESRNSWSRTLAQRLLLERGEPLPVTHLEKIVQGSDYPPARLHAAWLLETFGLLKDAAIVDLFRSKHPRVREHAALFAEARLDRNSDLRQALFDLASDRDPRLRFQTALSLGALDDDKILVFLSKIALAGADDPWTRIAVESAVPRRAGLLVRTLLHTQGLGAKNMTSGYLLIEELCRIVGARLDAAEIEHCISDLANMRHEKKLAWQLAGLNGLTEGMGRRGKRLDEVLRSLSSVAANPHPAEATLVRWVDGLFDESAKTALDPAMDLTRRLASVRILAHAGGATAEPKLAVLLDDPAQEVRLAAVSALATRHGPEVPRLLMKGWRRHTPAVRREVLEAMLRQPDRITFLLDQVQTRNVKPADIDAASTRRLHSYPQTTIRERARRLLEENLPADRKQVVGRYQTALRTPGDPKRGQEIFKKNCASCHRIGGIGVDVGPDISDTRTKTASALLVDILNPNQAIDNNAMTYLVITKSGKSMTGLIAGETASSITLRRAEGQSDTVLRQDIDEMQSTGLSLMPEGLEKTISVAEMSDLLAYLKNWRYLGKNAPVNR